MEPLQTDLEVLGRFIQLPYRPVSSRWQTASFSDQGDRSLGPGDWGIVALISFSPDDFSLALEDSSELDPQQPAEFPPGFDLTSIVDSHTLEINEMQNGWTNANANQHSADLFKKSPLLHGFAIPVTNASAFLLFLHTN